MACAPSTGRNSAVADAISKAGNAGERLCVTGPFWQLVGVALANSDGPVEFVLFLQDLQLQVGIKLRTSEIALNRCLGRR